jgi:hypothetical protein
MFFPRVLQDGIQYVQINQMDYTKDGQDTEKCSLIHPQ